MNPALWCERRDAFLAAIGTRPLVMGILNLTPDSFSDGGRFLDPPAALAQAAKLVEDGADIIDVGGESTRPGAKAVSEEEEMRRIGPVLASLGEDLAVPLSIDTYKANVARRANNLGACVVNDVWGLQKDPAMADTVAESGAALIVMHNRLDKDETIDILVDMRRFFDRSLALADRAGIPRERIILDPGIGFGKTARQNLEALAGIAALQDYGLPFLAGVSRKSFLGSLTGSGVERRLVGTIAANLAARSYGADIFRVHDAAEHVAALKVFDSIHQAARP